MTLPVGRIGSSGSRTGVLGSLSRGKRTVFVCTRPLAWPLRTPLETIPVQIYGSSLRRQNHSLPHSESDGFIAPPLQ